MSQKDCYGLCNKKYLQAQGSNRRYSNSSRTQDHHTTNRPTKTQIDELKKSIAILVQRAKCHRLEPYLPPYLPWGL
eukprot:12898860-Prorocentrum_lima.AAC.1